MSKHNLPKEPGLYWATDLIGTGKWEYIIETSGKAPLLRCTFLYCSERQPLSYIQKHPEKLYYGPKIEMPERDLQAIPPISQTHNVGMLQKLKSLFKSI